MGVSLATVEASLDTVAPCFSVLHFHFGRMFMKESKITRFVAIRVTGDYFHLVSFCPLQIHILHLSLFP